MLRWACKTDRGLTREINEDAMLCLGEAGFFMLADGVGGHNSGEVASNLAVSKAKEFIDNHPLWEVVDEDIPLYLFKCMKNNNEKICEQSKANPRYYGMATTSIMLLVRSDTAYIANVGDSRAYALKDNVFAAVTVDHTYVNELVRDGKISRDEAKVHPKRNVITRALGCDEPVNPDFYTFLLKDGDRILLCTDGLYNEVEEEVLEEYMKREKDPDELVDKLVRLACTNGGRDNISVCCVDLIGINI